MKIKSIIKRFLILLLFCTFAFSMLGATDPLSKNEFESAEKLAQEIEADCYYFDIDLLENNLDSLVYCKYILRPRNSCDVESGYSINLGYLITGTVFNYYENSHYTKISVYASFDKNDRVKMWPRKEERPQTESFVIIIDSKDYICYFSLLHLWIVMDFEIDDIIYTIELRTSEKWKVGEEDSEHVITEDETFDLLNEMISEVKDGLFERIYNTGYKKDGTKLVD